MLSLALWGQKPRAGRQRPGVLQDPAQLVAEHVGCPCSCPPSLATPSLADATADVVDSASVRFLAASALAARRKDEAEERARRTEEKVQLLAMPSALCFDGSENCGGPGCVGRACHAALMSTTTVCAHGWFCWLRNTSHVFPLGCRRPLMLGIMAGMVQKNTFRRIFTGAALGRGCRAPCVQRHQFDSFFISLQ